MPVSPEVMEDAHAPEADDVERCPLCGCPREEGDDGSAYCDACGCLLVDWMPSPGPDAGAPQAIMIRRAPAMSSEAGASPYREDGIERRWEFIVSHTQSGGYLALPTAIGVLLFIANRLRMPIEVIGVLALAVGVTFIWNLIPRAASTRIIAGPEGLKVTQDGAPLDRGQHFPAADVAGVFVRSLSRVDRPEDRRLEVVVLDRSGRRTSILSGLDHEESMAWIGAHIAHGLGLVDFPVE